MSSGETPGTRVELHDVRDVIGSGASISCVKFPEFHMFDTNWKLKLRAEWDDELNTNVISIRLRHRRRSVGDIWNLDATIKIEIDEKWLKCEVLFNSHFSHRMQEIEIRNVGAITGMLKESEIRLQIKIFMQIENSMGIQLRNYIDFSRSLPIFSNFAIRVEGIIFHVNQMILSMASPVFLQTFVNALDNRIDNLELSNVSANDFRRLLNVIYPPHLPPKQWIKENDIEKQLEHIYHFLNIAKSFQTSIAFEIADKWLVKYGRFGLGDALLLAQTFGLRELMGSKLAKIRSIKDVRKFRKHLRGLSCKTKALILDHVLLAL